MSYDITLTDPVTGEGLEVDAPHFMTGGTYALGGTTELWLNVTYNYADWYYKPGVFPEVPDPEYDYCGGMRGGIRSIYGMTGAESIPVLRNAIETLTSMKEELPPEEMADYRKRNISGYWIPTRANAIRPLCQLLAFAQMRPDGVWKGD